MSESAPASPLHLVADLHLTVVGVSGEATAHLHGGSQGLVLDVDHPAALFRQMSGSSPRRFLQSPALREVISDTPVQLRSEERTLARIRLSGSGMIRIRPTPRGLWIAARALLPQSRAGIVGASAASIAVALIGSAQIRRRHSAPGAQAEA